MTVEIHCAYDQIKLTLRRVCVCVCFSADETTIRGEKVTRDRLGQTATCTSLFRVREERDGWAGDD